jgi:hypothetical protein
MVLIASGGADTWLEENWTCSTGRGIRRETECGWLQAEWSAFVLAGAIALVGLVVAALASARDTRPAKPALTLDLRFIRRWLRRR